MAIYSLPLFVQLLGKEHMAENLISPILRRAWYLVRGYDSDKHMSKLTDDKENPQRQLQAWKFSFVPNFTNP